MRRVTRVQGRGSTLRYREVLSSWDARQLRDDLLAATTYDALRVLVRGALDVLAEEAAPPDPFA